MYGRGESWLSVGTSVVAFDFSFALIRLLTVCVDGAFVRKAIVTDCVVDASANSRLTGRALIVDDL